MKKIIILAFVMLTTTASFSQSKLYAYLLEHGAWNSYTEHWEYGKAIDVNLTLTIAKTYISINDKAETFLTIKSYIGQDDGVTTDGVKYTAAKWKCTDEKYRDCNFSMVKYDDGLYMLNIMYNNYSFRYYVKTTSLSNF